MTVPATSYKPLYAAIQHRGLVGTAAAVQLSPSSASKVSPSLGDNNYDSLQAFLSRHSSLV